jgi:hypothetical protein
VAGAQTEERKLQSWSRDDAEAVRREEVKRMSAAVWRIYVSTRGFSTRLRGG